LFTHAPLMLDERGGLGDGITSRNAGARWDEG
jgi:hypothetical protein